MDICTGISADSDVNVYFIYFIRENIIKLMIRKPICFYFFKTSDIVKTIGSISTIKIGTYINIEIDLAL